MAKVKTIIRRVARDKSARPKPRRKIIFSIKQDNYNLIQAEAKRLKISVSEYIRIRLNCQEILTLSNGELDGFSLSNKELKDLADRHLEKVALLMAN